MFSNDGDSFRTRRSLSRSSMFICENQQIKANLEENLIDYEANDMRRFKIEQIYGNPSINPKEVLTAHLNKKRFTLMKNSKVYRQSEALIGGY